MMLTTDNQYPSGRVELKGILAEFREALEEEIDAIKKTGQSSILLYAGRQIKNEGSEYRYLFNIEYLPSLPPDTPCKILIGKFQFDVTVVGFDESTITFSSKAPLPDTLGRARLENGATVLMERLIKCIEENAESENRVGKRLFPIEDSIYSAQTIFTYNNLNFENYDKKLNNEQKEAIESALKNDITYIWGPPGTGKTEVIGRIIDELRELNRSVLVVSHTNTAVDGAIKAAYEIYSKNLANKSENDTICPILRIGTPAQELNKRVLLDNHIKVFGKELYKQKKELEDLQTELQCQINKNLKLLAKDEWIKENKLEEIKKTLRTISALEDKRNEIRREIEDINKAISQEKAAHPEYAKYPVMSKNIKAKRADYDTTSIQIQKAETTLKMLFTQIQHAQDEIKKHDRYRELREQESRYMSVLFYQNELAKINGYITYLQNNINELNVKQTAAQQTISEYENKGSVAKFLGKGALTRAQEDLRNISIQLPQAEAEMWRHLNLRQKYNGELEALLYLQEQIKAVIPSGTQDDWKNELWRLNADFEAAKNTIPKLSFQRDAIHEEIYGLEIQLSQAKEPFDIISEYGEKLRQAQERFEKTNSIYNQENNHCSEQIERELFLYTAFSDAPIAGNNASLFDKLNEKLDVVKTKMASVDIEDVRREKENADKELTEIFRQLNELNQIILELERYAIMSAKIIGTTLAKSYLSEILRERKFDTLILDEASMASIPALWCAGYLAVNNIVIVGDFLQLPPIVIAETPMAQKWLGKNIFYHSGMQERAGDKSSARPKNFVMLNKQFRMEPDIADIANMYYGEYGGLVSDVSNEERDRERRKFYEWFSEEETGQNIHLIDTESLHAWVTGVPQGRGHSRLNCFSAAVDVSLAFRFLEKRLKLLDPATAEREKEPSVLIVAPYRPHVTRVNQLIELEYKNRGFKENLNHIRAGTIHSFQGGQADIVIFDLVIDEPHWKANLFMTDKDINDDLRKMFNVAITRAKFKLYIVGNFAYCQKRARNNALSELLDKLLKEKRLPKIDAKELTPDIKFAKRTDFYLDRKLVGKHIVCLGESFDNRFMEDVCSFKNRLIIYSPFMTQTRLRALLSAFEDAIKKGKRITVVTKALSERGKSELAHYQKCEQKLLDIGVNIIHKKGMHEKLIFVDSDVVWIGSLNALSFTGLTGEVMHRYEDRELTAEYEKLFDIEHIYGAVENSFEQKCPICEGEMLVKESATGGIYWECINGDYSRNVTQQYPVEGILRCKCGAQYVFAMKKEPRWVCSENSKHYQKMREKDLKLERMAALIPTKTARKEVDRYFSRKRKEREMKNKSSSTVKKKSSN